ncbi:Bidirectional sugar transporter NEC1 [Sesamum alatum]|uniref:Bidirectional sugar transporter SWEET n=1 Tax=Sesamum alatum TaxID=300844 RepID=A0AAE2CDH4_9LAMI|nr:Bidirectional sugar transporter NEC1 [Sesamum alatum]
MAIISALHMATAFGILGNIVSFLVYLAPLPTFYRIWKKKSTEGFQAIPYSVALFSAMLYLYYAFLKQNSIILITINTIGCATEITYLTIYFIYATKQSRVSTTRLLLFFNVSLLGLVIVATYFLARGHQRVIAVGWICAAFSVTVFAAPLAIIRQVIRTKSVEFMPFYLSLFLTICAVVWFFYGFLIKDYFIAGPNILGFVFGIMQMTLYVVYKDRKQQILPATVAETKVHDIITGAGGDIIVELKDLDHHQSQDDNSETDRPNKHDLEIVVLDYGEQVVRGVVVLQPNKEPNVIA